MNKTVIDAADITMRFRMNSDRILSLKEFVTTALRGGPCVFSSQERGDPWADWPQWGGEEHPPEGDFRYFEADRGQRDMSGKCGAYAGTGQRV